METVIIILTLIAIAEAIGLIHLAANLRAESNKLRNSLDLAYQDVSDAYEQVDALKAELNQANAKIEENWNLYDEQNTLRLQYQIQCAELETQLVFVKSDRKKLSTMLRGALDKLKEYNEAFDDVVEEVEEPFDPTKYKAFPSGYRIPIDTEVIAIKDNSNIPINAVGLKGKTIKSFSDCPCCLFDNEIKWMMSFELAPLNPTDHPEHPQFNKK